MNASTQKTLMSSARDDHNTPPDFALLVHKVLGTIDLDPCSNANSQVIAVDKFDFHARGEDGLKLPWVNGNTGPMRRCRRTAFVNPPYGHGAGKAWAKKVADEVLKGLEVIVLVPARTETEAFQDVYLHADAICFWRGRIKFWVDGAPAEAGAPFPSAVIYFGPNADRFRKVFAEYGVIR